MRALPEVRRTGSSPERWNPFREFAEPTGSPPVRYFEGERVRYAKAA